MPSAPPLHPRYGAHHNARARGGGPSGHSGAPGGGQRRDTPEAASRAGTTVGKPLRWSRAGAAAAPTPPPDITMNASPAFLTAEWRHLAMLNYEIDPAALAPWVPAGTALDFWKGQALVSVVGFLFLNTRVRGLAIPGHRNFEEVNLRFYVRRRTADGWRRGVVFIKELVPRPAIAFVARMFYQEPYSAVPMSHRIEGTPGDIRSVEYSWRHRARPQSLRLTTRGPARSLEPDSAAGFITEHYWGYNRQRNGGTLEYEVVHPPWRVQEAAAAMLECDAAALYGETFGPWLQKAPVSAFLAEGSAVTVHPGRRLD